MATSRDLKGTPAAYLGHEDLLQYYKLSEQSNSYVEGIPTGLDHYISRKKMIF